LVCSPENACQAQQTTTASGPYPGL
jgi:hypothetical protein